MPAKDYPLPMTGDPWIDRPRTLDRWGRRKRAGPKIWPTPGKHNKGRDGPDDWEFVVVCLRRPGEIASTLSEIRNLHWPTPVIPDRTVYRDYYRTDELRMGRGRPSNESTYRKKGRKEERWSPERFSARLKELEITHEEFSALMMYEQGVQVNARSSTRWASETEAITAWNELRPAPCPPRWLVPTMAKALGVRASSLIENYIPDKDYPESREMRERARRAIHEQNTSEDARKRAGRKSLKGKASDYVYRPTQWD
jgi:hypothetical protein